MYKVFFNDKEINIVAPPNITLNNPVKTVANLGDPAAVKTWFPGFSASNCKKVELPHPDPAYFFESIFMPAFIWLPAAGGAVLRQGKLLLIFRNGKWDLPKGKIDAGETPETAALREVAEECGITRHKIVKQLPPTFHIYQSGYKKTRGQWILKKTFWFEMQYLGKADGTPQSEENITKIKWFAKANLQTVMENTYENLKGLIKIYG